MKSHVLGLIFLAAALYAGTAQASTIFLSTTSTNPALTNPTLTLNVGDTAKLYEFWEPTTDANTLTNEQLSGWGHNIVDDNPILSTTTYSYVNPLEGGTPRWGSTNAGFPTSPTFLVGGFFTANAVKVGGSNLGFYTDNGQGYYNEGPNGVWQLSTLTFTATASGTSNNFLQVGSNGISFENTPNVRNLNFGFGDAGVYSASFGADSILADATVIVVPEPGTLALLGMGIAGLLAFARRRCSKT